MFALLVSGTTRGNAQADSDRNKNAASGGAARVMGEFCARAQ
jgi:hypothetical protein